MHKRHIHDPVLLSQDRNYTCFFNANGIVQKEFVPPAQTANQQFYLKVLKRLCDSVRKKQPAMWSSGFWFLHLDNAPAQTTLNVLQFLAKKKKQHDGSPSSSLFTQPSAMRLFPVPSYERPDERETFC